ncbi:hypothetical protein [Nonomuraea recticatena]|uniref:hypothetical protein n=1 Tax=Nonomuraea recticatena TaxID=46178 RepID=UPI003607E8F0
MAAQGAESARALPTGLTVTPVTESLSLRPGDTTALVVRLANTTAGTIRGEAQLASPYGTWELLPSVIQAFTVAPGSEAEVRFPVTVPADAAELRSWALAKVMWFGRCQYAPAVPLEVTR